MATRDSRSGVHGSAWLVAAGLLSLLLCGCPGPSNANGKSGASDPLEAMKKAYRQASSYADAGELKIQFTVPGHPKQTESHAFAVSLERPNKLRVDAFEGNIACDGKQFFAVVTDPGMSDQILFHPAPAEMTVGDVYSDHVLGQMLSSGTGVRLPQLELLLADKPLESVFGEKRETKRLEDRAIDDEEDEKPCQRVEVKSELGRFVAWIDAKTHVMRRLEMPVSLFPLPEGAAEQVDRVWVDFNGAKLGGAIDEKAFQFEAPPSAMFLKKFVAVPRALRDKPDKLLGTLPANFEFVGLDGRTVDAQNLHGKVVVIDMWFLGCPICFIGFPNMQAVYDKYKDDERVAFLTVNVDEPSITNKMLQSAFQKKSLSLPIVRDPQQFAKEVFGVTGFPTTILLGANGTVQDYRAGLETDLAQTLPKRIDLLLAGTDLAQETFARYEHEDQQFKQRKSAELEGTTQQFELPQAKIGEKTEPTAFRLTKLWSSTGIKNPGNILVIPGDAGPRIVVLDGWSKVVELDAAGKIVAEHEIELPQGATITQLRTAVDGQDRRYFAGFTGRDQQAFLFDNEFKPLLRYPPEGPHAGIFDVQLGDLNGDGQLELNIGYAGAVGVQNVSFEGERIWSNRSQDNVISLAVLDPDSAGHRPLWCGNERPAIAVVNFEGKSLPDVPVPNRAVDVLVTAHLKSPDQLNIAALAPTATEVAAIGLDLKGHELWSYPLPSGLRLTPCSVLIAGRVQPEGPGNWLLTGPDGSIHVLAADGSPIDKFNYGVELTGIGTAEFDGRAVLLVSSANELTAWGIEPAESAPEISATDR